MPDDLVHLRLESDDFACDDLQIFEISGSDALGKLFDLAIGVVCLKPAGLDLGAVEGAMARLVFEVGGQTVRTVHGMVAVIDDLLDTQPETRSYVLHLVPRAHRLSLVRTQEIFMDLSVPEIIQRKLELVGLASDDVEMRLANTYPPLEFVVQYRETDLAFVSRLAEHEGITFFFEHDGDRDKIVFVDQNTSFTTVEAAVPFRSDGDKRDVYKIEARTRIVPRMHVVHDYNYRAPLVDPTGSAEAPSGLGGGLVEYGAHVKTPADAARLAKIRSEETEATHKVFSLESDLSRIPCGGIIGLEGHPKLGDAVLLVTEMQHSGRFPVAAHGGNAPIPYTNTFRAIDAAVPFRPARVTPKPRIHGVVNGVVSHESEGTESLFARLDEDGRYLVRILFDTSQPGDRKFVSRRIRMAQPHSGPNYGHHYPLKPGTEVLVGFVDGDPDRPIILATVPNAITPSPVAQNAAPAHRIKTATGILIEMKDA
jgi:type VI secretion system secreted protein VgrG